MISYGREGLDSDVGSVLGGDKIEFTADRPLRIIIGGPPHSGKSTLMHLIEDKFRAYGVSVELVDLDLSAPTQLREGGFDINRPKRKWSDELADEAKRMFEEADSEVVLGDSVGLISSINEIISEPADVSLLLVSGGHGDYDATYRKVIQKWKDYYADIHVPLLVVLRSSMNPEDVSSFDPQHNYGVMVGLDRDAFQEGVIDPANACIEGIVFEIAQTFDLILESDPTPEHLAILEDKWPALRDKKTWNPIDEGKPHLANIERDYFEQRGRVPADQMAETFGADMDYYECSQCFTLWEDEDEAEGCCTSCVNCGLRAHGEHEKAQECCPCSCDPDGECFCDEFGDCCQGYLEDFSAERSDDGIVYVDEDNSIRLAKGSKWMRGSGGMEDHYVDGCNSCHEKLDGYKTQYVVSPRERWAYCMECFDQMKGREDVIIHDAETFGADRYPHDYCLGCYEKPATIGAYQKVICEDCYSQRTGRGQEAKPRKVDCGSCGEENISSYDLMRCAACGDSMCESCPGDGQLCRGCDGERGKYFGAEMTRFTRNPNSRDALLGRGRRATRSDPATQEYRRLAGAAFLLGGAYIVWRAYRNENDDTSQS